MLWLLLACTPAPDTGHPDVSTDPTGNPTTGLGTGLGSGHTGAIPSVRDRPLPEIQLIMAHNAMASADDGFLAPNQTLNYEGQLALGVRGFMLDIHDEGAGPELCHSSCAFGREPLVDGLARFDTWLADHPDELVVFVLQDEVAPPSILEAFAASGLDARAIEPPATGPWPSWNELVARGEQVLVTTEGSHDDVPSWYAAAYDGLAFDNDYAAKTVDDFDCEILRGDAPAPFALLNHFLTHPIALPELAEEANAAGVLTDHIASCTAAWGRPPSWVAVDFVELGAVTEVVPPPSR